MSTINNKSLMEMTAEELIKYKKMYSEMTILMLFFLTIAVIVLFYLFPHKGFNPFYSIPFSFCVFVYINFKKLNEVKRELNQRNT